MRFVVDRKLANEFGWRNPILKVFCQTFQAASERGHSTIGAAVGRSLDRTVGVRHQGAGVAHHVAEGAYHIDIVDNDAQGFYHVAADPGSDLQVGAAGAPERLKTAACV